MTENPWPPPLLPQQSKSLEWGRSGRRIIWAWSLFAFFPILVPLVASIFVSDAFNESTSLGTLPWLTIMTVPLAGIGVVITFTVRGFIRLRRSRDKRI